MTKRMLIDATHAEETRVAIVSGNKLEDFDYESASRKQLKGNIFLVKVTRVEPSLQAAFVDFGGNRHGFLPFPEIHPDYYRIPMEDREALLAEQRAMIEAQRAEEEAREKAAATAAGISDDDIVIDEDDGDDSEDDLEEDEEISGKTEEHEEDTEEEEGENDEDEDDDPLSEENAGAEITQTPRTEKTTPVEMIGGEDDPAEEEEEAPRRRWQSLKRRYKIQEVIKRGQVMLIQVTKEERGNKGAAVTTYVSLPGRYCVLMPNSPRGGGVSRKVGNVGDRQRLKKIMSGLEVPEGMSVIIRTAGISRSKAEIKRDLDYLLRLWDEIREQTLQSTAPALIYEEGDLIKRAIRDLYRRDIDEIIVSGEEGFKAAREFMKKLMPSHIRRVAQYEDEMTPLFFRYQVEKQIDEIYGNTVQLKSGGYIVINQTEALVSIDINSGRATRERHIEETALKTNLEAASEIGRQLRLRDLGGLVVIDFIDMEDYRNNRAVERRLKEAMSTDRARIQLGRISVFGLLELSRQRLRPSLVETHFETCTRCKGAGLIRTVESTSVMVLRILEEESMRSRNNEIHVFVPAQIATYILNHKRAMISDIERRYKIKVFIEADENLSQPDYRIEKSGGQRPEFVPVLENDDRKKQGENRRGRQGNRPHKEARDTQDSDTADMEEFPEDEERDQEGASSANERPHRSGEGLDPDGNPRRRRRRGRRGGRRRGRNRDGGGDRNNQGQPSEDGGAAQDLGKAPQPGYAPAHNDDDNGNRADSHEKAAVNFSESTESTAAFSTSGQTQDTTDDHPKRRGWWRKRKE